MLSTREHFDMGLEGLLGSLDLIISIGAMQILTCPQSQGTTWFDALLGVDLISMRSLIGDDMALPCSHFD